MGLEADDGRPETSPPLRRGVQTADRAVVRERQAIPGDQGRVRHRAIDPAALGPRHPRQRLRPGRGVDRAMSCPALISRDGLPLSHDCTICRLNASPWWRGCFGPAIVGLQSHVIRPSSEGLIHCSQSTSAAQRSYLMYRSTALSRCSLLYFAIRRFSSRSGSPRKRHHLDALKRKVSCGSYEMRMKT